LKQKLLNILNLIKMIKITFWRYSKKYKMIQIGFKTQFCMNCIKKEFLCQKLWIWWYPTNNGLISLQKNKPKKFWIYLIKYTDTQRSDQDLKNRTKGIKKKIKIKNKKKRKLKQQSQEKRKCWMKYSM
jgi:hypothetical protein